jgi:hypothetical protein
MRSRLLWFVAIYAASVAVTGAVTMAIKAVLTP